jgi:hypothetical protein
VPFNIERVVIGFALLGLGVLWLLANAGRLDLLWALRTWWPMLLVVWGALELAAALSRRPAGRSPRPPAEAPR